ncbi:uncharacterized protein RSE6_14522 [Rhynchosporium secalis]|uniref:Uncharacterized protein n=1 Tax=Rhynchosporium secalis TaxID=38038 RepID=A0A1E1MVH9_RHYSE|nr:uncharacterized protein RSE6_14522 [Rhynchosporium secalis]
MASLQAIFSEDEFTTSWQNRFIGDEFPQPSMFMRDKYHDDRKCEIYNDESTEEYLLTAILIRST